MRIISRSLIGLTTALALTVAACGDSLTGTDAGVEELTDAEVAAFVDVFFGAFDAAEADIDAQEAAAAPAQAPQSFNFSAEVSVPCESGSLDVTGTIAVTFDDVTEHEDGRFEVSINPMGCVVSEGTNTSGTSTFTIDGDPRVDIVVEFTVDEDGEHVEGSMDGGFSFESSDGRSGSCAIDVSFSFVSDGVSVGVTTVSGTICGLNADTFEAFDEIADEEQDQI
jgi:hypothetical protein